MTSLDIGLVMELFTWDSCGEQVSHVNKAAQSAALSFADTMSPSDPRLSSGCAHGPA